MKNRSLSPPHPSHDCKTVDKTCLRHANLGLGLVDVRGRVDPASGGKASQQCEDGEEGKDNDGDAAEHRLAVAKVGPLTPGLTRVALDRLKSELVVDHAAERNAVAEELQGGDLGAPDDHGGDDEHDVFENTAEGEHEGGGLANLLRLLAGNCKGIVCVANSPKTRPRR